MVVFSNIVITLTKGTFKSLFLFPSAFRKNGTLKTNHHLNMSKILIAIVFVISAISTTGQFPKKIELFDAVKMFAPDSVKGDGYPSAYDWNTGSDRRSSFKWRTESPEFTDDKTMKKAQAIMAIKDSILKCNDGKDACPWSLTLEGARMGYTKFNIVSPTHPEIKIKSKIDELFPGKKYHSALVRTCEITTTAGFYLYELTIPGKKKVLMKISWARARTGSAIALVFYTDFRDADLTCSI